MIEGYSHVGLVVKDINKALDLYTTVFGAKARSTNPMSLPGGKAIMVALGNSNVELIEPTDSAHRVGKFLKEKGEGLFHLSCRVANIEAAVKSLREKGIVVEEPRFIMPDQPGARIAFLDPGSACGAYIELAESARRETPRA
jgi:methylmalonyl-CoA/ethylmalonyl-CoA epimerase